MTYNQELTLKRAVARTRGEWDDNPSAKSFKDYKEAWAKLQCYMQLQKLDVIRHWEQKRRMELSKS